ncbi:MAG: retroviral-like aspartic protease family protein [Chloroflexi bacterium]|nr:retroviral-like aspartic protease family protein [Chloroflexota bacterium]
MIKGYLTGSPGRRRPFVHAVVEFPALAKQLDVELLIDTRADHTVLAPRDAQRLGVDLTALGPGQPSIGVGGQMQTHTIVAVVLLETFITEPFSLTILDPLPGAVLPIPSLLGRDLLSHFALFLEERTSRALLLEPSEVDELHLP